jgi:parallel beta-helix repeat protein
LILGLGVKNQTKVVQAYGQTLFVDDDNLAGPWDGTQEHPFSNITTALLSALDGDTIFVCNGTYNERLNVTKQIMLQGQNVHATIIDGNQTGEVIQITASKANVSGFTIHSSGLDPESSGISIIGANENSVNHNVVRNSVNGIRLYASTGTNVANNTISNSNYGIVVVGASGSTVIGNIISTNVDMGIRVSDSSNVEVRENTILNSTFGIALVGSTNSTLFRNNIQLCNYSIYTFGYGGNTLSTNQVSNCYDFGIWMSKSEQNTVTKNEVYSSRIGIYLSNSIRNTIEGNILRNNIQFGLRLDNTTESLIYSNILSENFLAAVLAYYSNNNTFFHNNCNSIHEVFASANSTNLFDLNGEGNYWSDYNGTDSNSDALGDSPYIIDANNQDRYPLMGNFSVFKVAYAEISYDLLFISNSVISQFAFNETIKMLQFNTTNFNETTSFCRITIPEQLINRPHVVIVNKVEINVTSLISNATCTSLYFVYNQDSQVKILSKPYYELWVDYTNLRSEYYNLTDKFRQLEDNFTKLSDEYLNLNSTNRSLQENLSLLQSKYDILYQQFLDADFKLTNLSLNYSNLLAQHELLNINFTTLQLDLAKLQESHNNLSQRLQETLSLLEQLRMESEDMKTYENRLLYSLIAAGVTVALLSAILAWNVRLVRRQKMLLGKYGKYETELQQMSHIEAARVRFETDVIRRHEKIEKFEQKYGITIKPRSRLEDAITSLELEEEKRK